MKPKQPRQVIEKKIRDLEDEIKRLIKYGQATRASLKTVQAELQQSSDRLRKTMGGIIQAMSSHRPYRPALGPDHAIDEIRQQRGILYDADAVDACLKVIAENRFLITQPLQKEK